MGDALNLCDQREFKRYRQREFICALGLFIFLLLLLCLLQERENDEQADTGMRGKSLAGDSSAQFSIIFTFAEKK